MKFLFYNQASLLSLLDTNSFAATEIDIFRAVERWAAVHKPDEETVKAIVKKIRLATISQKVNFIKMIAFHKVFEKRK